MHPSSPHYQFHPDSIGWLHRKHKQGGVILQEDVARILDADPDSYDDPTMRTYMFRLARGELKPRRGRPSRSAEELFCIGVAAQLLNEVTEEIREERRAAGIKGGRTVLEPCVEAANRLSDELWLPRGRSLSRPQKVNKTAL